MATMIPDQLPDKANAGEETVWSFLKAMPDDVWVYFEPDVRNRYPDFVVLHPRIGVIVIEVKGYPLPWITYADSNNVKYRMAGNEREDVHPVRQGRDYMFRLKSKLEHSPLSQTLLSGGKLGFGFGHIAILTGIDRQDLDQSQWGDLFPTDKIICRNEIERTQSSIESLEQVFRRSLDGHGRKETLTEHELQVIRSVISPRAELSKAKSGDEGLSNEQTLVLMDAEQEGFSRSIGGGHRIIYGVPGSGKTIMLIYRARMLAEMGKRVLFLCYNEGLETHLIDELSNVENVRVIRFGRWAMAQGTTPNNYDHEVFGDNLLKIIGSGFGDAGSFDAVLIDEGQDFAHSWFKCAINALSEPQIGDLMVAYDINQNLYNAQLPIWSRLGIRAQGRTKRLTTNYRNTKQIAALAQTLCFPESPGNDDQPASVALKPENCVRSGPVPILVKASGLNSQIEKCADLVESMQRGTVETSAGPFRASADEIMVLTHTRDVKNQIHSVFRARKIPATVSTIHGSRGLQAKAVLIVNADSLKPARDRSLLYVGLTRPEDFLAVFWSHDTPLTKELEANMPNKTEYL